MFDFFNLKKIESLRQRIRDLEVHFIQLVNPDDLEVGDVVELKHGLDHREITELSRAGFKSKACLPAFEKDAPLPASGYPAYDNNLVTGYHNIRRVVSRGQ